MIEAAIHMDSPGYFKHLTQIAVDFNRRYWAERANKVTFYSNGMPILIQSWNGGQIPNWVKGSKLIPEWSDLVLNLHYTINRHQCYVTQNECNEDGNLKLLQQENFTTDEEAILIARCWHDEAVAKMKPTIPEVYPVLYVKKDERCSNPDERDYFPVSDIDHVRRIFEYRTWGDIRSETLNDDTVFWVRDREEKNAGSPTDAQMMVFVDFNPDTNIVRTKWAPNSPEGTPLITFKTSEVINTTDKHY